MRKNKFMRAASGLLVAVLLTTCVISGTFAKYTTSATGSDSARVATWGFDKNNASITLDNLFSDTYDNVKGVDSDVIAPGTTGSANFEFKYSGKADAPEVAYTFKVDTEGSTISDDISLTLEYKNKNTESENVSGTTTVSFGEKAAFEVTSSNDTLKATAPANDPYTHWENKTMVWKISNNDSSTKLPSDAKLTVSTMNAGETQTSIYQQNQSGEFVIPFIWSNSKEFKISLDSEQAGWKGKTYTLKAELFVGNYTNNSLSLPQAAEGNTAAGSTTINVKIAQDTSPAVRITGTQRIMTVSKGSDTTLDLNVETKNTEAYQLSATIEQKNNGEYTGKFLETDVTDGENKFSIGVITTAGSYRLLVRVIKDNQIIMTVPYYFIVKY